MERPKNSLGEGTQGMTFTNKTTEETKLFAFESGGMEMKSHDDVATRPSDMGDGQPAVPRGETIDTTTAPEDTHVYKGMAGYKDYRAGF